MIISKPRSMRKKRASLLGTALGLSACSVLAQTAPAAAPSAGIGNDPSPYYIGVNQALTHDSNAFRVPFGPSDNYSSSTLLGGFDQPFGRQRAYGTASVSLNRYQHESELNNTSYSLLTGIDWATIWRLSGNVTATLDQQLVAPAATVDSPDATRNLSRRKGVNGLARWGGDSVLNVEGRLGYVTQDGSGRSSANDSTNTSGSLGVFYHPGPLLSLGLAARFDRTRSPFAFLLADGTYQDNDTRGRNVDFLIDYSNGNSLRTAARISYTRQSNSSVNDADFSGLTGSLSVSYRATGKTSFNFGVARDAGFNSTTGAYPGAVVTVPAGSATTPTTTTPVPVTLYENNQVTNSANAGASYAATSKINLSASARYARANIVTSTATAGGAAGEVADKTRGFSLGGNYAYSRALSFACSVSRERREVSGVVSYAYTDDIASCSAQFIWR